MNRSLYNVDFYAWANQQAEFLQAGHFTQLDQENLLEEIQSMGRSVQRELESRLEILLMHLLKWCFQTELRGNSWRLTIEEQRRKISRLITKNPSLKSSIDETFDNAYGDAILSASRQTGFNRSVFPVQCPWLFDQVINHDFWPDIEIEINKIAPPFST